MFWSQIIYVLVLISAVACVPSWDGFIGARPQASIGNLVPGASFIESLGSGISFERYKPKYLVTDAPKGVAGSLLVQDHTAPPLFYINNQQLWQLNNQTSILRVNVMNVTDVPGHPAPLKLEISDEEDGLQYGVWRWRGTKLHYDLGKLSNDGVWLKCQTKGGKPGIYTSLIPGPAPEGCSFTTLHSFVNRIEKP
ncbi:hypothetical protein SCHPADRAFT_924225 [Schizopora paradoxa]|uniref:Uncharacterized protein n=1 Tax=Schizopora paradoxa TaxID=27342 RepID=A0A0H2S6X3_9AGAM|nr:hypothetical protein SCHPADRAFT_924225 [Schizopora paradoxa]